MMEVDEIQGAPEERMDDETLTKKEIIQLEHEIIHLKKSNTEMEQFIQENGHDAEFRTAIVCQFRV